MKIFLTVSIIMAGTFFSACSAKKANFYDRANNASEKSLDGLDRDTK